MFIQLPVLTSSKASSNLRGWGQDGWGGGGRGTLSKPGGNHLVTLSPWGLCDCACVSAYQAFGCPCAVAVSQVSPEYLCIRVLISARARWHRPLGHKPLGQTPQAGCVSLVYCTCFLPGHGIMRVCGLVEGHQHASLVVQGPWDVCRGFRVLLRGVLISHVSHSMYLRECHIAQLSTWRRPEIPVSQIPTLQEIQRKVCRSKSKLRRNPGRLGGSVG